MYGIIKLRCDVKQLWFLKELCVSLVFVIVRYHSNNDSLTDPLCAVRVPRGGPLQLGFKKLAVICFLRKNQSTNAKHLSIV